MSAILTLRDAGGGALRYLVGGIPALSLGVAMVWLEWKFLRYLVFEMRNRSKRWQNLIALGALFYIIIWLAIGGVMGLKLGTLPARHIE